MNTSQRCDHQYQERNADSGRVYCIECNTTIAYLPGSRGGGMSLAEALAASTVQSATFSNVEDIVHCGPTGQTWWWLKDRYVQRDRPLPPQLAQADGWFPVQPIVPRRIP